MSSSSYPDSRPESNGLPRYTDTNPICQRCENAFECSNGEQPVNYCPYISNREEKAPYPDSKYRERGRNGKKKGWSDPN